MIQTAFKALKLIGYKWNILNVYTFSTNVNHPTIDKILKSDNSDHLELILPELVGLSQKNREMALKLILNKIFSAKIPQKLLDDPRLSTQLAKHSQMIVQASLFRIKEYMKSLNELTSSSSERTKIFDQINSNFLISFQNLKKIPQVSALKSQVMLHKRFADYNLLYLSKSVSLQNKKQILQKSKQFYISTLQNMGKLISSQQQKLRKVNQQQSQQTTKTPGQIQEGELKCNAIRENIRLLIQTNSQNLFHLFIVQKQLSKNREKEISEGIIGLLPYFATSLNYYKIFSKMTPYSIFYHRIKKIFLEINYYSKILAFNKFNSIGKERKENDDKLWKELIDDLDKLYEETIVDIKIIVKQPKHVANLQEMALLLLNIQVHKDVRKQQTNQMFKNTLINQVSRILDVVELDDRRTLSFYLGKVVKQMMEERSRRSNSINNK